jgi:hypothetical protein
MDENTETAVTTTTVTNLVSYGETEKKLAQIRELYKEVPDCTTKEGYEVARSGIRELVSLRTGLEKDRVLKKADALAYGRRVDDEAGRVKDEILALELPLKAAKKAIDDEKEAKREAKKQAEFKRVNDIRAKITHIRDVPTKAISMTSDELSEKIKVMESYSITLEAYHEFFEEAQTAMTETLGVLRQALAEKINAEKVAKEQEAERLRLKAEADELERKRVAQQAELDRQREESARKQAEIDAENKRKADELAAKQEEENRKRQAELDRQQREIEERERKMREEEQKRKDEEARIQREKEEADRKETERKQKERFDAKNAELREQKKNEAIQAIDQLLIGVDHFERATIIVEAIQKGEIPNVTFN